MIRSVISFVLGVGGFALLSTVDLRLSFGVMLVLVADKIYEERE